MIEQVMYFLLGAMSAALLAMAALPALWRRAVRLTRLRLEATLPLTPDEIAAQKDQIRAQSAVEARRLEQKLETAEGGNQSLKAEIGRLMARSQEFETSLAHDRKRLSDLENEHNAAKSTIATLEDSIVTLSRERDNVTTLLNAARIANQGLEQEAGTTRTQSEQRQLRIAELESQSENLIIRMNETQALNQDLQETLRQRGEELRNAAQHERVAASDRTGFERKLLAAESTMQENETTIGSLQTERASLIADGTRLTRALNAERADRLEAERNLADAKARIVASEQAHARERADMQTAILDLTRSVDNLLQEKSTLTEEVSSLRFAKSRLETDLARIKRKDTPEPTIGLVGPGQ